MQTSFATVIRIFQIFISCAAAQSAITNEQPSPLIVLDGTSTTLKCLYTLQADQYNHYTQIRFEWSVEYMSHQTCTINSSGVASQGCRLRQYQVDRVQSAQNSWMAKLIITQTTLSDAGTYKCESFNKNGRRQQTQIILAVLAAGPSGEANRKHVTAGDNITYTCRAQYNSSAVLKMAWSTLIGETVSPPGGRVSTDDSHDSLIHLESKLTIAVPVGVAVVPLYVCSVISSAADDRKLYAWNSTSIIVSHCPRNVAITTDYDEMDMGSQLKCQSDAVPSAIYRWIFIGGSGNVSGVGNNTLTVTSLIANVEIIEIRCTAVNFFDDDQHQKPCYASASVTVCNNNWHESDELPVTQSVTGATRDNEKQPTKFQRSSTARAANFNSTSATADLTKNTRQFVTDLRWSTTETRRTAQFAITTPVAVTASVKLFSTSATSIFSTTSTGIDSSPALTDPLLISPTSGSLIAEVVPKPIVEGALSSNADDYKTPITVLSLIMAAVIAVVAVISVVLFRVVRQLRYHYDFTRNALEDRTSSLLMGESNASITTEMTSMTPASKCSVVSS